MIEQHNCKWQELAFKQNRWTKVYRRLVERARNRHKQFGYEKHHIVPDSFFIQRKRPGEPGWLVGDPDTSSNLVLLTWREHRLAHRLLSRISLPPGLLGMKTAEWFMIHATSPDGESYRISSRQYERLRQAWQENISGHMTGVWKRPDYVQAQRDIQPTIQRELWSNRSELRESARNTALSQKNDPEYVKNHHDGLSAWAKTQMETNPSFLLNSMIQLLKAQEARRDDTVYHWSHKDGREFIGTRSEIRKTYNLPDIKQLFLKHGKNKTAYGWKVSQIIDST